MSEPHRRARAASRQATSAVEGYTEADVSWTELRTIALMQAGVTFTNAVSQAAMECSLRIFDRQLQALQALEDMRERQRDKARAKREAEQAERRSELEVRGELGQRPSLKTSLGDLLAARRR